MEATVIRNRDFTESDAIAIAYGNVRLKTEKEMCLKLGLNPAGWRNWKLDNKEIWGDSLARATQERLDELLPAIQLATTGGNDAAGRPVRQDWRAAERLIEWIDPRRFGDVAATQPAPAAQVNVTILSELSRIAFGPQAVGPQAVEAVESKQIESEADKHNLTENP